MTNYYNEYHKEYKRRLKAAHRCTSCGVLMPEDYKLVLCAECTARNKAKWHENKRAREAAGICVRCGKEKAQEGRKSCFKCLYKKAEMMHKRRYGE